MTADPYEALSVQRTASLAEIKKAYRRVARTDHPDLNPDDPAAEARFKAAAAAYDLLKDPEARGRFDRGETDADGAEAPPRGYYRDATGSGDGYSRSGFDARTKGYGAGGFDPEDLFARFARGGAGGDPFVGSRFDMPGRDARYKMAVPFLDAVRGTVSRITLPEGGNLAVTIPEGATDGLTLRLRGKGGAGTGDAPPGDAYVTLAVANDPLFRRAGEDIHTTLDISLDEAVLGGKVPAPTVDGEVRVSVPAGASSGRVLRLRGRGVAKRGSGGRGDQLIELRIAMPAKVDDDLRDFFEGWRSAHGYDPRDGKVGP